MIADLKPYPAMKNSGLPWLPEVPEHWGMLPNRAMLRRRKVLVGSRHPDYRLLSLTKQGVIVRDVESGKGKFSADMGTSQEVRKGDLIFCLFDVPETPRTVGLSRHDGMITGAYTVFECHDSVLARYLDAFYRAMDDRKLLSPLYSGLRNTIPPACLLGVKTPMPPADEQSAIVRFLEYVERHIARHIRAKQMIIALIAERKQHTIHHAVTHGLDPTVKLRRSGLDWLGDAPAHWELRRAKYLLTETDSRSQGGQETLLRVSQYTGVTPRTADDDSGMPRAESLVGYKRVMVDDLVINIMIAWNGSLGVSAYDGIVSPAYCVYRFKGELEPWYFHYLLHDPLYLGRIKMASTGVIESRLRLYTDALGRIELLVPPRKEQETIATFIRDKTAAADTAIQQADREITLLHEYRARLVADVVTGKLDVREAAAALPEDLAEQHFDPAELTLAASELIGAAEVVTEETEE